MSKSEWDSAEPDAWSHLNPVEWELSPGVRALEKVRKEWNSAHVCPRCGFPIDLEALGLRGGTTGLVTCPKCEWSGPIEIRIVNKEPSD